jgi:hypothetical protein
MRSARWQKRWQSSNRRRFEQQKSPVSGAFPKRMNGLEPSTFCMAITLRVATGTDKNRHPACSCGFSGGAQRQEPSATDRKT